MRQWDRAERSSGCVFVRKPTVGIGSLLLYNAMQRNRDQQISRGLM